MVLELFYFGFIASIPPNAGSFLHCPSSAPQGWGYVSIGVQTKSNGISVQWTVRDPFYLFDFSFS